MSLRLGTLSIAVALLSLHAPPARAHWCDNLWASSYNIVVRPETDTATGGSMSVYVQNNMGYQLVNFKLSASVGGASITATPPTTLKVANTLLPGEKGTWKLSGNGLTKIEDVTFSVSFGSSGQSRYYPTENAAGDGKAVMVVKTDGSLYPATAPLPGLANPTCCGDVAQARSLQYPAMADFEDTSAGLDKLMTLYCAGRASWGGTDGVSQTYCKTATSIDACPTTKPGSGTGSKFDYMHLWAAGELAARKAGLGAERTAALRARLQCGVNDANLGFAGYALIMLGYLGEDPGARTFLEAQSAASGDLGAIAKAALLLLGSAADMTTHKAAVQAGLNSASTFVAAASATALGIAAKDDAAVTGTLIPRVEWIEPDTSDNGQAMYAAHLLALVAWDRRGWAPKGADTGGASFYGNGGTPSGGGGAGGNPGSGGTSARGGASGSGGTSARGGATGSGGTSARGGATGSGGTSARGGASGSGGTSALPTGMGGTTVSPPASGGSTIAPPGSGGATVAPPGSGGADRGGETSGSGGSAGAPDETGGAGGSTGGEKASRGGCAVGRSAAGAPLLLLALPGVALLLARRRRGS